MKIKYIGAIVIGLSMPAFAQDPAPAPGPQPSTFLQSVSLYFSSFNTNLPVAEKTEIFTGAEYVQGLNTVNDFTVQRKFAGNWSFESVTKNAGIAGTIVSQQAGIGYNIVKADTELTGYIDGGYDFDKRGGFVAIGARVKKMLTEHTFSGIGLETQIGSKRPSTPTVSIFAGFTF